MTQRQGLAVGVNIVQRLYNRLGLTGLAPGMYREELSGLVSLVLPIDKLTQELSDSSTTTSHAAGTVVEGTQFTVPVGHRWHITVLNVLRASGDNTLGYVTIVNPAATISIRLLSEGTAATYVPGILTQPLTLDQQWTMRVQTNAVGSSTTVYNVRMQYWDEEAY